VREHLYTLEQDMLKAIRDHFPKEVVATVDQHEGDFGAREIESYAKKANALILVANGGESIGTGGVIAETQVYDLFIFVKGRTVLQRTRAGRLIYERTLKLLHARDTWVTDETIKGPANVKGKNLYGPKTDEMGVGLWVVRWDQYIQIPYLTDTSTLDDFRMLWADYFRPGESPPDDEPISSQAIELEQDP
jgi:phage gp37-like protein